MRQSYWTAAMALLAFSLTACDGGDDGGDAECVSDRAFFVSDVQPILKGTCTQCHNAGGDAQASKLVLVSEGQTAWIDTNMSTLRDVASFEKDGKSILLTKPTLEIAHGGGKLFETDSPEYAAFAELITRFDEPQTCGDENTTDQHSPVWNF